MNELEGKSIAVPMPTAYGMMLVPRWDVNQSLPLFRGGQSLEHSEIMGLRTLAGMHGGKCVYADVGANIGTHTLGVADLCAEVHAFEAQRIIYNCLAGSVAMSNHRHIRTYNKAVWSTDCEELKLPIVNYWAEGQFGGISLKGPTKDRPEPLGEEIVETVTLDSFFWERLDLLKIDVEGAELEVIEGAMNTIRRCRPVMLIEHLQMDYNEKRPLPKWIGETFKYDVHPAGMNIICIPVELRERIKLEIKETK